MPIVKKADQLLYTGRGPLDAKALVKTYAELLSTDTWTTQVNDIDTFIAYNGMMVAVWLNKTDTSKNGIYFLHDPLVTSVVKRPDVTIEANWHKLGSIDNLPGLTEQLSTIQGELDQVQADVDELQDSATVVVAMHSDLPITGTPGKIYVVTEDAATYVWHNNGYLAVGDGTQDVEIQIIHGGSASVT